MAPVLNCGAKAWLKIDGSIRTKRELFLEAGAEPCLGGLVAGRAVVMGINAAWIAVKGVGKTEAFERLGFIDTGEAADEDD